MHLFVVIFVTISYHVLGFALAGSGILFFAIVASYIYQTVLGFDPDSKMTYHSVIAVGVLFLLVLILWNIMKYFSLWYGKKYKDKFD